MPYFWKYDWQTDAMTERKYRINAEQRFYKQEYCGCSYSLRDSNIWRKQNGIPPVQIGGETAGLGSRYFENPEDDAREESVEVRAQRQHSNFHLMIMSRTVCSLRRSRAFCACHVSR
mmetsp:Transcript_633/g.1124  ORF Transcript_633/g.1124 Transcript_633/m.1124 type:complete len:117 (-) Transcript_633:439-789(-)